MIKLKDLLCCCDTNVHIMSGPVPALVISKSLNYWRWIDPKLLNTEIKRISSNDFHINVWLKIEEDEND